MPICEHLSIVTVFLIFHSFLSDGSHTMPLCSVKTRNTFQILVSKTCNSTGCQMQESGFIAHFNLPSFSLGLTSVSYATNTFFSLQVSVFFFYSPPAHIILSLPQVPTAFLSKMAELMHVCYL